MPAFNQSIPCPECQTNIAFNAQDLLSGKQFSCPSCHASIGLSDESKPKIQETLKDFEELKKRITGK